MRYILFVYSHHKRCNFFEYYLKVLPYSKIILINNNEQLNVNNYLNDIRLCHKHLFSLCHY